MTACKNALQGGLAVQCRLRRRLPAPQEEARHLLARAARAYHLSARTYHRLLKVAWTIADLDASPLIGASHMSEALHYRMGERERVMIEARD